MTRASFVVALVAGLLAARPAAAQVTETARGCAPFEHVQAYRGWGPADAYGRPVTVVYRATRCSTETGSTVRVVMEGTAAIYRGTASLGSLIDRSPFAVTGTWLDARNPAGWPLPWWECRVTSADYTWQIPGAYTFSVSVRGGLWTVDVDVPAPGEDVHWTYRGCD